MTVWVLYKVLLKSRKYDDCTRSNKTFMTFVIVSANIAYDIQLDSPSLNGDLFAFSYPPATDPVFVDPIIPLLAAPTPFLLNLEFKLELSFKLPAVGSVVDDCVLEPLSDSLFIWSACKAHISSPFPISESDDIGSSLIVGISDDTVGVIEDCPSFSLLGSWCVGECFVFELELEDDDDCGETPEAVLFGTAELFVVLMPVALLLLLFVVALVADGDCPLLPPPVDVALGDLDNADEFNTPSDVDWLKVTVPVVPGVVGDDDVVGGGVIDTAATESVVDEVADDVDANRSDFSFIILLF